MKKLFAYRLKNARKLRGLSMEQLAQASGVSKQMISKYEKAQSLPGSQLLIALAKALEVKPEYFFRPEKISIDQVNFRKKARTSKKEIESIKVNILNKLENYLEIENILSLQTDFRHPLPEHLIQNPDEVEELAESLRQNWQIGKDAIGNIVSLFEKNEIKVVEIARASTENFDGMATFVNARFPAIIINRNFNVERKRFTLMHELGHLLLKINPEFTPKEVERICDRFAGAVLLPREVVFEQIGIKRQRISLEELMNIQKEYGISIQAIIYRLRSLNIISQEKLKSFFIKLKTQESFKEKVNQVRFLGDEKSYRYKQLVYKALSEELISIGKAAELLNCSISEIQKTLTLL